MSAHEDHRRRAGALWAMRARMESEAQRRFARLAVQLADTGADDIVVGLARRAAADEERHQGLCAALARELGAQLGPAEMPDAALLRSRLECPSDRVLHEVVAMSCVTETLSAALLAEMRARATDTSVRDVVHEVLCDEVTHARLGWAHVAWARSRGDIRWLAPHVPAMLAATVHEELFAPAEEAPDADAPLAGLGGLGRGIRRDIFVGTMRAVVLPGLARFGVDTRLAQQWLDLRCPSAQRPGAELLGELREHVGQW